MKLYTKEMFLKAAEKCEVSMIDANHIMQYIDEYVTPIELPSDEEIKSKSSNEYQEQKQSYEDSVEMFPIDFGNYLEVGFIDGAKWMRDKIKGGEQ